MFFSARFMKVLLLLLLLSHFSCVQLCAIHRWQPTRLPRPWDSPGKNTGVGCHYLFQCRKVKSESEVAHSCPTLRDPMDCSPPGYSVHGIFQTRVLKWIAKRTGKPGILKLMGWQRVRYVLGNEQLFAAGTKYHKRSGPEQKKCIVSPLWRLKV